MGKFFNLDSPFMRILSRVADLMILNILVLLTCFPIITVGAAMSAMHYVLIKMIRNEENYITKMYFKAFKENFKQGTVLWLIMMAVIAVFAGDFYILTHAEGEVSGIIMIAILAIAVLVFMTGMYVFPMQARFVNTVGRTLRNSFFMMVLNFPKSILMLFVYIVPVLLFMTSNYAVPFLIMFGVSVPGLGAAYLYKKVFSRFEPEEEAVASDMEFSVDVDEAKDGEADNGCKEDGTIQE